MSSVNIESSGDVKIFGDVVGRDKITVNLPPPLPPAEAKDRANLLILLRKVKTFWIEGVLEKSIHNAVLLELGKETRPEAVDHPWEMVLELPDQTNQVLPSGTKIIDIFEKMNRAMLILGEPGSGKTITLLELARDLVTRAETDPSQPVPVVFNLSSWTDKHQPLHDWLVFELSTKYQIPKRIGRVWLQDNRILPLLDGLDEVNPQSRLACVEAINRLGETFGLPGCVVCSRLEEYTILPVRLKLNGAVCLRWLTLDQINSYLEIGGNKFSALRTALLKDKALQGLAQSPLILSILCLTYQEPSNDDLTGQLIDREDYSRKHLFDTYIQRMFLRRGKSNRPYSKAQTLHWLSWLAQNMTKYSQTVFLIESMQPSWLQTRWMRRLYSIIVFAIIGLIIGLNVDGVWKICTEPYASQWEKKIITTHKTSLLLIAELTWALSFILLFKWNKPSTIPRFYLNPWIVPNHLRYWLIWVVLWMLALIWFYTLAPFIISFKATHQYSFMIWIHVITGIGVMAFVGAWGGVRSNLMNEVQMAEALGWSWAGAKKGLVWGNLGSFFVVCLSMTSPLSANGLSGIRAWLADEGTLKYLLTIWFVVTMFGVISNGLSSRIVKTKTLPNQGIKLSIRNSLIVGLTFGILLGLASALIWMAYGTKPNIGLGIGLLFFSFAVSRYGGIDVLIHFILRLILYFKGNTPRRYVHFLDYATNLIFLQKVGGGYVFIHRLLLAHFAAMPLQSKTQKK